jgi:hypothetical protein
MSRTPRGALKRDVWETPRFGPQRQFALQARSAITGRDSRMARCHLRIYHGPETLGAHTTDQADENTVRVSFGEIYPLLADAVNNRRTWLRDFENDDVTISTDLYEVLLAYQYSRRPSA